MLLGDGGEQLGCQELEAADFLRRNDAHPFLDAIGDTVITGLTGTNVGDLVLVYRHPPA